MKCDEPGCGIHNLRGVRGLAMHKSHSHNGRTGKPLRKYVHKQRPFPVVFPCGCRALTYDHAGKRVQTQGFSTIIIMNDGRRICSCGKFWRCAWVETPQNETP